MSLTNSLIFGSHIPTITYKQRLAAYAIIHNSDGELAVVQPTGSYFLPGGGAEAYGPPEQTLVREVEEELGCRIQLISKLGVATQYFFADEQNFEMIATFFLAEIIEPNIGDAEYELVWVRRDEVAGKFFHECHDWFAQHCNS